MTRTTQLTPPVPRGVLLQTGIQTLGLMPAAYLQEAVTALNEVYRRAIELPEPAAGCVIELVHADRARNTFRPARSDKEGRVLELRSLSGHARRQGTGMFAARRSPPEAGEEPPHGG